MEKIKKILAISLITGGLAGGALFSSQLSNVSAEETEEQSAGWDCGQHNDEAMQGHMNEMHGRATRVRGNRSGMMDNEGFSDTLTDEERELMQERHDRMWEFRNENNDGSKDQSGDSAGFFGSMRNHMRGFGAASFDEMLERMEERHGSFSGRRGMMNWNQDEQSVDSED